MRGTLIEVINRLDEVGDSDGHGAPCLFTSHGRDSLPTSPALVCPIDDDGTDECPQDASLSYILMVEQAKDAIEVWAEWRGGRSPTPQDKFDAVMHYVCHDAYLPTD